jgi:hypothetical protein
VEGKKENGDEEWGGQGNRNENHKAEQESESTHGTQECGRVDRARILKHTWNARIEHATASHCETAFLAPTPSHTPILPLSKYD